jgi:hypothetical protein
MLAGDKRSSLSGRFVSDEEKTFLRRPRPGRRNRRRRRRRRRARSRIQPPPARCRTSLGLSYKTFFFVAAVQSPYSGTVFTTLHFLRILNISQVS